MSSSPQGIFLTCPRNVPTPAPIHNQRSCPRRCLFLLAPGPGSLWQIIEISGAFHRTELHFLVKVNSQHAPLIFLYFEIHTFLLLTPSDSYYFLPAGPGPRLRHQHRAPHWCGFP